MHAYAKCVTGRHIFTTDASVQQSHNVRLHNTLPAPRQPSERSTRRAWNLLRILRRVHFPNPRHMSLVERGLAASVPRRDSGEPVKARSMDRAWSVAVVAGAVFAILGWTDVLLLWYPLRIGTPEWEFATISGTFDALPLATIGTLVLVAYLVMRGRQLTQRIAGGMLVGVSLAFVAAFILFALSFVTGIAAVGADTKWILYRAGIKTAVSALAYTTVYVVFARSLFRATRKDSFS